MFTPTGTPVGTSLLNRKISTSAALATGAALYGQNQATYTQANTTQGTAAGNYPADTGAALATPTGYTAITTTPSGTPWDASTVAVAANVKNGAYCQLTLGIDNTFALGAGQIAIGAAGAAVNAVATFDEQALPSNMAHDVLGSDETSRLDARRARRLPMSMRRGFDW